MKISKNTFWLKNKTFIVNCNTFYTESWECPSQIIEHFGNLRQGVNQVVF